MDTTVNSIQCKYNRETKQVDKLVCKLTQQVLIFEGCATLEIKGYNVGSIVANFTHKIIIHNDQTIQFLENNVIDEPKKVAMQPVERLHFEQSFEEQKIDHGQFEDKQVDLEDLINEKVGS